jgi:hypothetical protein
MIAAFLKSLRDASREWPWAIVWTVVNLALSGLAALPAYLFIRQVNGASLIAERLLSPGLDIQWVAAAWHSGGFGSFRNRFLLAALVVGVAYALLNVYLTGGMIALFRPAGARASFFSACRRYAAPLLAASVISAVGYAGLLVALLVTLGFIFAFDARALRADAVYPLQWAAVSGFAVVATLFGCTFDYMKIGVVLREERNPLRALRDALRLVARRPGATFGLYWLTFALWIVVAGGATWFALTLPQIGWTAVIAVFFVQQIAFFLRGWLRLVFFAGECHTYALLSPPVAPPDSPPMEN